ncbi:trafficking regulator of GLUT4 1-like [Ruditapes philippinarum]|uniref:trafficking regulator of GLUT4 1-like n=1 Tax=Ruditapes philippinarum TaxID=129788 RepID=UPI00295A7E3F|nr:trafficking regulator of GLUT4 1-like [Ruditapes philippinarum]
MAEKADGYTDDHAKYGVEAQHPDQPGITRMQPPDGHDKYTTTVVINQPQTSELIVQHRPTDYMVSSMFACLCCFCPTGTLAIYYASEANNLARAGFYASAKRMSDKAKKLMIISVIVGIILWVVLLFRLDIKR